MIANDGTPKLLDFGTAKFPYGRSDHEEAS